jgi:hypothetical protein
MRGGNKTTQSIQGKPHTKINQRFIKRSKNKKGKNNAK